MCFPGGFGRRGPERYMASWNFGDDCCGFSPLIFSALVDDDYQQWGNMECADLGFFVVTLPGMYTLCTNAKATSKVQSHFLLPRTKSAVARPCISKQYKARKQRNVYAALPVTNTWVPQVCGGDAGEQRNIACHWDQRRDCLFWDPPCGIIAGGGCVACGTSTGRLNFLLSHGKRNFGGL
jgi:hypothetical protein